MEVQDTPLAGVRVLKPRRFGDHRGFFCETWNAKTFEATGIDASFVQDNQSLSSDVGTLRGLHFQRPPYAQAKLVRCGRGRLRDVVVDIRVGSDTFGQSFSLEMSANGGEQLFVPVGFLHGFVTLEPDTEILYKCTAFYSAEHDGAVRWNDPALAIDWGLGNETPVLSDKDAAAPLLSDLENPFTIEDYA